MNETAKGPVGWDENQFRKWVSMNHHTALAGIAALRANMILQRLEAISKGDEEVPEAPQGELVPARPGIAMKSAEEPSAPGGDDLMIPIGDSGVPDHADQEIPRGIGYIKLSRNEVLRIIAIAKSGMNDKEKAFHLRWSKWRRKHQATSRWYHRVARMRLAREPGNRPAVHDLTTVRSARLGRQSKADPKAA